MTATRNAPLISVVIPCYNQARYLADAITSALGQTHKRVPLVVVDDGSVDNTAEVVARYLTDCFVRHGNQGAAEARNVGILHRSGEYVLLLDADDRLTPTGPESYL